MQMAELFEKAITNSKYLGDFEYGKLLDYIDDKNLNAVATNDNKKGSIILIFVDGEAAGAAQIDDYGMLYGDKVIYSLDKSGTFKLYTTEKNLADSLAARTRIFDKKYLKPEKFSSDLQDIKSFSTKPSKIKFIVIKDEKPLTGVKVILKKDNAPGTYDYTSFDGSCGFVLQGGDYLCSIIENEETEHSYHIKLEGKSTEITIKL
ncbi:MAG: hypothetical protein PHI15_00670 [Methanomicrobium sp.]|nr:hypothetical protein [Methanomicrobium sp.]